MVSHADIINWYKLLVDSIDSHDHIGPCYPSLLGSALANYPVVVKGEEARYLRSLEHLTEIFSETAQTERRFLYNFVRQYWDGFGDIIEIGPLFGGTSRAIAMGVRDRRSDVALQQRGSYSVGKFYVYDRFDWGYSGEILQAVFRPFIENGVMSEGFRNFVYALPTKQVCDSSCGKRFFEALHSAYDYFSFMNIDTGNLPDYAETVPTTRDLFQTPSGAQFSIVFIDGCKSWFGTKYFMMSVVDFAKEGSYFIFQDYGTYTCFWLPAFIHIFSDYFRLVASVHHTYTFRLIKPLTSELVDKFYPNAPHTIGLQGFHSMFDGLMNGAVSRGDAYQTMNHQLQHAGAIAYLGDLEQSRRKILGLLERQEYSRYHHWISLSLKSPTYSPEGPISLG